MGQGKNKILWWGEWGGIGDGRTPNLSAIFSLRTFLEEVEGCSSIMSNNKGGGLVVIVGGNFTNFERLFFRKTNFCDLMRYG